MTAGGTVPGTTDRDAVKPQPARSFVHYRCGVQAFAMRSEWIAEHNDRLAADLEKRLAARELRASGGIKLAHGDSVAHD